MEFLVKNGLATDSEYKRRSGFVEYPMAMLNLPLLYQHNPQIFQKANIELFGEECNYKRKWAVAGYPGG